MKMKIELFKKQAGELKRIPYVSAAFDGMAKAREVAFADGGRRGADEAVIASEGSALVQERWVRDGEQWKRFEPPRGRVIYDPVFPGRHPKASPPKRWSGRAPRVTQ